MGADGCINALQDIMRAITMDSTSLTTSDDNDNFSLFK